MSERLLTVDIGDIKVSNDPGVTLVTYALGSCIAVCVYEPTRKVAGMIHYMLPMSAVSPEKAKVTPGMFADTGVPLLFEKMYALGCKKPELVVKVVGGAQIYDDNQTFEIGQRNYAILRKMFWKVGVLIAAEDVGSNKSRTARLAVGTGLLTVRSGGSEVAL
jgi:chemotaxis protein CheD